MSVNHGDKMSKWQFYIGDVYDGMLWRGFDGCKKYLQCVNDTLKTFGPKW